MPQLVPDRQRVAANACHSLAAHLAFIAGPAGTAALAHAAGSRTAFLTGAVLALAPLVGLAVIRPAPSPPPPTRALGESCDRHG